MRTRIFVILLFLFFGINTFAQRMAGFGGEFSMIGFNPNLRVWTSKTTGYELFGGLSSELGNFNPNDLELGFKYLSTFVYQRTSRNYVGFVGKWKWVSIDNDTDNNKNISFPVAGVIIGKEWSKKQLRRTGFAIELGYQYGTKSYKIPNIQNPGTYTEFPIIMNLRYTFYNSR